MVKQDKLSLKDEEAYLYEIGRVEGLIKLAKGYVKDRNVRLSRRKYIEACIAESWSILDKFLTKLHYFDE